jgi:uncharacterized protein YidB (DUF937 family)
MGLFDDVLGKATPDGNLTKPIMIALGTLLVGKMLNGGIGGMPQMGGAPQPSGQANPATPGTNSAGMPDGGLLGGLGGLLEKLQNAGQGDTAKSWIGTGPNKPIEPKQLGTALGQTTISDLAKQAGVSEQDLLAQLSKVLPGVVDKLTPNGQLPSLQDLAKAFLQPR